MDSPRIRWIPAALAIVFVLSLRLIVFSAEPVHHIWKNLISSCAFDALVLGIALIVAQTRGLWFARGLVVVLLVLELVGSIVFLKLGTYVRGYTLIGQTMQVLGPSIMQGFDLGSSAGVVIAIAIGALFRAPMAPSRRSAIILAIAVLGGGSETAREALRGEGWAPTSHSPVSFFLQTRDHPKGFEGLPLGVAVADDWAPAGEVAGRFEALAHGRPYDVVCVVLESVRARSFPPSPEAPPMPNVSALLEHAIRFDRAYVHEPRSVKGLEALLFGTYPTPSWEPVSRRRASIALDSVPQRWKRSGYATAYLSNSDLSFENFRDLLEGRGIDLLSGAAQLSARYQGGHDPDAVTVTEFDRFLAGVSGHFGAFLWTESTHHPYVLRFVDHARGPAESKEAYLEAIAHTDTIIGMLLDVLRRHERLESTIVVLVGDHGESFGEHPGTGLGHGLWPFDESIHVPLILANPAFGATVEPAAVQLKDLASTLSWLAGDANPLNIGCNLFAVCAPRAAYAIDTLAGLRASVIDDDTKYIWAAPANGGAATERLFDLRNDPAETNDLSATRSQDADRLRLRLFGWFGEWTRRWDATDTALRYRDHVDATRLLGSSGIMP